MNADTASKRGPRVVILGGGSAGVSVAARLVRALRQPNIVIVDPSRDHYYQPLWTLVGGGVERKESTRRRQQDVIPRGVEWAQEAVVTVDPDANTITTDAGRVIGYDYLVVATGIQLDWGKIKGLEGHLGKDGICSNYTYESVDSTWRAIQSFRGGNALFTQPSSPIKCAGAPQKIMYLADDAFRKAGVRDKASVVFMSGAGAIFSQAEYGETLKRIIARKGIEARLKHELVEVRPEAHEAVFQNLDDGSQVVMRYDMLHITPPMSAPEFIKQSKLAQTEGPQKGYVKVDRRTLQSPDYPNVFALGDSAALPTSKTGAAIRKQAPVVVNNLLAALRRETAPQAAYDGYTSCPLVTGYGRLILAEFDYDLKRKETFPVDQNKERRSMYLLKRFGLPVLYWYGMLKGIA